MSNCCHLSQHSYSDMPMRSPPVKTVSNSAWTGRMWEHRIFHRLSLYKWLEDFWPYSKLCFSFFVCGFAGPRPCRRRNTGSHGPTKPQKKMKKKFWTGPKIVLTIYKAITMKDPMYSVSVLTFLPCSGTIWHCFSGGERMAYLVHSSYCFVQTIVIHFYVQTPFIHFHVQMTFIHFASATEFK